MSDKSITISVTIPKQLEEDLQSNADDIGISRSRFICNLLLDWQSKKDSPNECDHWNKGFCDHFEIDCKAPQSSALSCDGYRGKL